VYGFGEKTGRLDKRGWKFGGYHYAMWNTDTYAYDSSTDPIYVSIPFYLVVRHGQAHGIFLDNTWRSTFDVGRDRQDLLTFEAEGGDLDYYFINGPAPKQVIERYGFDRPDAAPAALGTGYQQCRWSYYPNRACGFWPIRFVKRSSRRRALARYSLPDSHKPFTGIINGFPIRRKCSPTSATRASTSSALLIRTRKGEGLRAYDSGIAGNHFVK
jgi:alpha-glucosidase